MARRHRDYADVSTLDGYPSNVGFLGVPRVPSVLFVERLLFWGVVFGAWVFAFWLFRVDLRGKRRSGGRVEHDPPLSLLQ